MWTWRETVGLFASAVLIVFFSLLGWAMGSLPAPKEDKRVAKIKKHRDAHVKRSAQPQPGSQQAVEPAIQASAEPEAAEAETEATPEPAATEA